MSLKCVWLPNCLNCNEMWWWWWWRWRRYQGKLTSRRPFATVTRTLHLSPFLLSVKSKNHNYVINNFLWEKKKKPCCFAVLLFKQTAQFCVLRTCSTSCHSSTRALRGGHRWKRRGRPPAFVKTPKLSADLQQTRLAGLLSDCVSCGGRQEVFGSEKINVFTFHHAGGGRAITLVQSVVSAVVGVEWVLAGGNVSQGLIIKFLCKHKY